MTSNIFSMLMIDQKTITPRNSYATPGSSFITRHNKSKVVPLSGSGPYCPGSNRKIRFRLPAEWTDMNDSFTSFTLQIGGTALGLSASHNSVIPFNRMRIICGGTVLEDIQDINVIETLLARSTNSTNLIAGPYGRITGQSVAAASKIIAPATDAVAGDQYIFRPKISGILTNDLIIPQPFMPEVMIELHLENNAVVLMGTVENASDSVYQISDVAYNTHTIEYSSDFIDAFESSLADHPLHYYYTIASHFNQNIQRNFQNRYQVHFRCSQCSI
ncbi:hypothetical protein SARC_10891 [Sphaeroforma arctica JP610]|uniref:Uncharacterized protein n=1 Tax=Sphaeroforma arctica JP610 TaxID=667725 RepID=A0A0L0FIL5_9EUKA|nr:hypothetical protein SARC_10891 [Sphaeroforma arctica JP610]KNC76617.1 hypothetical protein SARC_10891 [Sphaeroforma arctica JP610]|eukprot:XP_014150519.1 hypothetical protein SARC_10891 [Sphaeroforma arctica JP610]